MFKLQSSNTFTLALTQYAVTQQPAWGPCVCGFGHATGTAERGGPFNANKTGCHLCSVCGER